MKYIYLEREENFTETNLIANRAKVLQLKWLEGSPTKDRMTCLNQYEAYVLSLFYSEAFKEASYEERKNKLRLWLAELRVKYPNEFLKRDLGWYDFEQEELRKARAYARRLPIPKKFARDAKKEGRVSVIKRMVG